MLLAALAVLAGIVIVASGRGGEMAYEQPDYPPLDLGPVTAADVALLRPPSAAWGYNMRVTDEALAQIARAMSERDVRISALEQRISDLREEREGPSSGPAPRAGARHRPAGESEAGPEFTTELPRPVWPPVTNVVPAPETGGQGAPDEQPGSGQPESEPPGPGQPGSEPPPAPGQQPAPGPESDPGPQAASGPPWALRSAPRPGPGGNGGPWPRPRAEDETGD